MLGNNRDENRITLTTIWIMAILNIEANDRKYECIRGYIRYGLKNVLFGKCFRKGILL